MSEIVLELQQEAVNKDADVETILWMPVILASEIDNMLLNSDPI